MIGGWLQWMILSAFSNLGDSVIVLIGLRQVKENAFVNILSSLVLKIFRVGCNIIRLGILNAAKSTWNAGIAGCGDWSCSYLLRILA